MQREETKIDATPTSTSKGNYTHFMEKEIYEQPDALGNTINGRLGENDVLDNIFGLGSSDAFKNVKRIQFVACGTSLHAAKTARKWFGNKITNQQAKDEMFKKFTKLIKLWKRKN